MDSAEPLSSILWTPPPHPGESAAAGKCRLPRVWGNLGSLYPVLPFIPSFEYGLAVCVRAGIVRVSVDFVGLVSFVFHWWWIDCSFLRLRNVLQWSIVGICADRDWIVSLGG